MIAVASRLIRRHPSTVLACGDCTRAAGGVGFVLKSFSVSSRKCVSVAVHPPLAPSFFKSVMGHVFPECVTFSSSLLSLSSSHAVKLPGVTVTGRFPVEAAEACPPAATSRKTLNADSASSAAYFLPQQQAKTHRRWSISSKKSHSNLYIIQRFKDLRQRTIMFKHATSTSLHPKKLLVRNTGGQLNVSVEQ
jgi:hypothetical protein